MLTPHYCENYIRAVSAFKGGGLFLIRTLGLSFLPAFNVVTLHYWNKL